jgi:branched-chain amino acid transport system permease protein
MSATLQFYVITLLVYFWVNVIAALSLNLQFGVAGVMNFAFIVFQAAGGYAAAVVTLGPSTASGYQSYIGGSSLPWPVPLLVAAVAGALLAWLVGLFAFRPARRDFQALVLLVVSIIATVLVSSEPQWFNGSAGLAAVPQPFSSSIGGGLTGYGWFYVGLSGAVCVVMFFLVRRLTSSPWAERLRAIRDNPIAAATMGINVRKEQIRVFVAGGAIAAVSGAVLVQFIGSYSPADWGYTETFFYFTAIVIGGLGNNFGVCLGVTVVFAGILESVRFLPQFNNVSNLSDALPQIGVGVLIVVFLWFRPEGLLPERRRGFGAGLDVSGEPSAGRLPGP